MEQFNNMAKGFLDVLNGQISDREHQIKILVTDMAIPKQLTHNLSITTVDMRDTKVVKKGAYVSHEKMKWEKDIYKKRGTII